MCPQCEQVSLLHPVCPQCEQVSLLHPVCPRCEQVSLLHPVCPRCEQVSLAILTCYHVPIISNTGPYLTPDTNVNIMIIIDTSEDFQNSFDYVVRFLLEFIDELFIGEDRTTVGVMLMGDSPIPAVMMNITSRGELTDAINQIEFVDQQNSNPADALGDLPAAFTSHGDYSAEEANINMAFLFTDGDNTNTPATIQAAMAAGEANITIFVVGVGGENQTTEENRAGLEAIANATGGHSVLYVDPEVPGSFSALIANLSVAVFNPSEFG